MSTKLYLPHDLIPLEKRNEFLNDLQHPIINGRGGVGHVVGDNSTILTCKDFYFPLIGHSIHLRNKVTDLIAVQLREHLKLFKVTAYCNGIRIVLDGEFIDEDNIRVYFGEDTTFTLLPLSTIAELYAVGRIQPFLENETTPLKPGNKEALNDFLVNVYMSVSYMDPITWKEMMLTSLPLINLVNRWPKALPLPLPADDANNCRHLHIDLTDTLTCRIYSSVVHKKEGEVISVKITSANGVLLDEQFFSTTKTDYEQNVFDHLLIFSRASNE